MIKNKKFIHQLLWLLAGILPWGFGDFWYTLLSPWQWGCSPTGEWGFGAVSFFPLPAERLWQ